MSAAEDLVAAAAEDEDEEDEDGEAEPEPGVELLAPRATSSESPVYDIVTPVELVHPSWPLAAAAPETKLTVAHW